MGRGFEEATGRKGNEKTSLQATVNFTVSDTLCLQSEVRMLASHCQTRRALV